MQFHVENMTCGGCARSVAKAIQSADPAAQVETDPATRKAVVTSTRPQSEIEAALTEAGYPARTAA
jgi:copper chaperone